MNAIELDVEMRRHGENGTILAAALGITQATFSNKKNGVSHFNQGEIMAIKERYDLSAERVGEIFFAQ